MKGLLFDIQRFSLHDGPGIRTVFFFKGCALNCQWCSNPEGIEFGFNILFNENKCDETCFRCADKCLKNTISKTGNEVIIDYSNCDFCGACVEICPKKALTKSGNRYSANELFNVALKDIKFYKKSGGGVTFSGGEAMHQPVFLELLIDKLKSYNIHLCLETSGYFNYASSIGILKKIDIIYFDLKVADIEKAEIYTGGGFNLIKNNLKKISNELRERIIIRIPLIPKITATEENLHKIKEIMLDNNLNEVELLPFHKLGFKKYSMLKKENKLINTKLISLKKLKEYLDVFKDFNVRIEA